MSLQELSGKKDQKDVTDKDTKKERGNGFEKNSSINLKFGREKECFYFIEKLWLQVKDSYG